MSKARQRPQRRPAQVEADEGSARGPSPIALPLALRVGLLALAVGLVVLARLEPMRPSSLDPATRAYETRVADDGREHVYLGDYDSYLWLRHARNYLRTGTSCDAIVDGACRDTYTLAPVGVEMRYGRSVNIAAIVAVHRVASWLVPGYPLDASAGLAQALAGGLGALAAFAIGRRLRGDVAGLVAAVVVSLSPKFLARSISADDDVWNVVMPLVAVWAVMRGLGATGMRAVLGWGLVAGIAFVVHVVSWSGWVFAYAVVMGGLVATALFEGGRSVARTRRLVLDERVRRPLVLAAVVSVVVALAAIAAGRGERLLAAPGQLLRLAVRPPARDASPEAWPGVFSTIQELRQPSRAELAFNSGDAFVLLVGIVGMIVALLPVATWRRWYWGALAAVVGVSLALWLGPEMSGVARVAILAAVVVATVLWRIRDPDEAGDAPSGPGLVLAVWVLAAAVAVQRAMRFSTLIAGPLGVAFGVAVAEAVAWLWHATRRLPRAVAMLLAAGVVAGALAGPIAYAQRATRFTPEIGDAWWDLFERLRLESPADAVVTAWWDYGHWIKYVAERRVSVDGASMSTHVPHWIGRALMAADEAESVGLLRMLACGSDATPEPEGGRGAFGALVARGMSVADAHDLVVELARLDRSAAEARLAASGLDESARRDVLRATHCDPPPLYLVLSTREIDSPAWAFLARWKDEWAIHDDDYVRNAGAHSFLTRVPVSCAPAGEGDLFCPLRIRTPTELFRGFLYRPADAADGQFSLDTSAGLRLVPASTIVIAQGGQVREVHAPNANPDAPGVLLDADGGRIVVAPPHLVRSTFARLMFLDARYAGRFDAFDQRELPGGGRVITWRVRWDAAADGTARHP
jgi:hypothetical protein